MGKLSGEELQAWFRDDRNIESLYIAFLPAIKAHVKTNGGSEQDARDLFQEAIVVLYKKSKDSDFILSVPIETYLFAIAKRIWLSQLRKRRNADKLKVSFDVDEGNEIEEMVINHEVQELYIKHFKTLGEGCRKLLNLFFNGLKMKEIAKQLELASEGYVRKRKHECQKMLVQSIQGDPVFVELKNG